ncbi:MAG: hypothetical protein EBZ77_14800 [Chitinophagia bacterium]|nr:hypothetical protein [Chitinophagia bacterium]
MRQFRISIAIFLLSLLVQRSFAQIVVAVRPVRPVYTRIAAPTPRHVWIEEEWVPSGGTYIFRGGRWMAPPRPGLVWVTGHWRHRRRGWVWIPGHWR